MPYLYVVATPIGNLQDITLRAVETLKQADLILAEDTRVSQNLLARFSIKKPLWSYHQHSKLARLDQVVEALRSGQKVALISDAGTPGISDPGNQLIEYVIAQLGDKVKIEPIPGPSALTCLASVAGFSMDRFLFLGFPPQKNKRRQFFEAAAQSAYPVAFYESPYRILKSLQEFGAALSQENKNDKLQAVVGRELTKKFETIYRGSIEQVIEQIKKDAHGNTPKGEFTVIVRKIQ